MNDELNGQDGAVGNPPGGVLDPKGGPQPPAPTFEREPSNGDPISPSQSLPELSVVPISSDILTLLPKKKMGRPRIHPEKPENHVMGRPRLYAPGQAPSLLKARMEKRQGTQPVAARGKSLTSRQEKMALLMATGMNQGQAYRQAYECKGRPGSSIHAAAYKVARHPKVIVRMAEMREKMVDQASYSLDKAMEEAEAAYQQALLTGQPGAAVSAVTLRARLHGLLVEDRANAREALSGMTDKELEQLKAEATRIIEAARGGLTVKKV